MARESVRSRCRQRLELLAKSGLDVDSLRIEAIEQLRHVIGFERWGVPLVDPDTLIPNRALVSDLPPWGPRLPERWILDQSVGEINSRAMLSRGRNHVGVLSAATGGDLARCDRWREMGQPIGMGDELRAAIVDEHGCWGSFELFRASDDRSFDNDDAQLMRDAAQLLAPAFRRARVSTSDDRHEAYSQTGVLMMGEDLRPWGITQAARAWFAMLDASHMPERTPLPIHVYGVVGRLVAAEAGEDPDRPPRVRVRTADGRWAVVEGARLHGPASAIVITVRGTTPDTSPPGALTS